MEEVAGATRMDTAGEIERRIRGFVEVGVRNLVLMAPLDGAALAEIAREALPRLA